MLFVEINGLLPNNYEDEGIEYVKLHVYYGYSHILLLLHVIRGPHQYQAKIGDLDASRKRTK